MDEIQSAAQRRHQQNASFAARGSSIQHGGTRTRFVSPDASPHTIQITGMVRFRQSGRELRPDEWPQLNLRIQATELVLRRFRRAVERKTSCVVNLRRLVRVLFPARGAYPGSNGRHHGSSGQYLRKKKLTSAPRYRRFFSFILIRLLLENADSHAPQYVRTLLVVLVTCRGLLHPGVAHCLTIPTDRRVSVDRRSTGPGSMRRGCFCFLKAIFRGLLLRGCHDLRVLDSIFTRFHKQ